MTRAESIGPDETSDVVEAALAELGADLLARVLEQIAGNTAREEPQDPSRATYAPRLTKEEGLIDWSQSSLRIHNRVRGLYPWPHAYTFLDGARLIVLRTRIDHADLEGPRRGEISAPPRPGTILEVTRQAIQVATGEGGQLAIVELQAEGGRPMDVRNFVGGHLVKQGAVFSGS